MPLVERIQSLAKTCHQTLASVERILSFGNGSIRKWNTNIPSVEKLQKVADYFDVSVDYLLGRTDNPDGRHAVVDSVFGPLLVDEVAALKAYLQQYRKLKEDITPE